MVTAAAHWIQPLRSPDLGHSSSASASTTGPPYIGGSLELARNANARVYLGDGMLKIGESEGRP